MDTPAKTFWSKRRRFLAGAVFVMALLGVFLFWPRSLAPITTYAECVAAGNPILETDPPICQSGSLSFTGHVNAVVTAPPSTSVPFEILVNGDLANAMPRSSVAINSQSAWAAYWARIHTGQATMPPILPVDFTRSTVIAMNEGPEQTNGYVYKVTGVSQAAITAIVDVTESIPSIGCPVQRVTSNRYFIVQTDKLHGSVAFRITTDHRRCDVGSSPTNTVQ